MKAAGSVFKNCSEDELREYIRDFKERNKGRVIIPVHHYVPSSVVEFADFTGDSYKLAVEASATDAEWIVFCGVSFMAEGVEILRSGNQKVLNPEPDAGCPMADMIDRELGLKAIEKIREFSGVVPAPVVYMNSYADSKSLCGEYSGSVCTSSNAEKVMKYFLAQGKNVFFFPDMNLGRNTARSTGLKESEIALVTRDFRIRHESSPEKIKLFLWEGMCPVHHRFKSSAIDSFRKKYPEGKIIAHPEVKPDVAQKADMLGSTQKIFDVIGSAPEGSVWGVGTEAVFVERLAEMFSGKTIVPVEVSRCVNMSKNSLLTLAESLASIEEHEATGGELKYQVSVPDEFKENAKKALSKMISIVEEK